MVTRAFPKLAFLVLDSTHKYCAKMTYLVISGLKGQRLPAGRADLCWFYFWGLKVP